MKVGNIKTSKRMMGNQIARKYPIFKPKLKVGDQVWLSLPLNGQIVKISKYGYEIEISDAKGTYAFFNDNDILRKIKH